MNQKRGGQDTPLKSQNYVKQSHFQSIKEFSKRYLNDGSKPADFLVPKGLATGPDGKDFQETFKNGIKPDAKKQQLHGMKRKELEKTKLQLSY